MAAACVALLAHNLSAASNDVVHAEPVLNVPFLASHYYQSVALLADGGFALSGTATIVPPGTDGYPQFEVQSYAPDGALLGNLFVPEAGRPVDTGGIVPLGDHYLVTWQHYLAKTSAAVLLDRQDNILKSSFTWPNSDIEYYQLYYRWSGGLDPLFLPVMFRLDGAYPNGDPFRQPSIQVFDFDTKPLGVPVALATNPSRLYFDDAAINGQGRFIVLYSRCARSFVPPRPCPLGFQIFTGAGQPQTPLLSQNVAQAEGAFGIRDGGVGVGIAPDGRFLLIWAVPEQAHLYALYVRLFDQLGAPLTDALELGQAPPSGFLQGQARGLADGTFALTWGVAEPSGDTSIYVSRFDPNTRQAAPPLLITTDFLAAENYHFDVNDSGQGVITWATYHPENTDNVFAGYIRLLTFPPYRQPKPPPARKQRP